MVGVTDISLGTIVALLVVLILVVLLVRGTFR